MKKRKLDKPILAEGEVTGHAHVLSEGVDVFELEDGSREFALSENDTVKHQEHKPVDLPAKEYIADRVIEKDHVSEEVRKVQD